jgi:tetratricopeptide (TPR) repeat protein
MAEAKETLRLLAQIPGEDYAAFRGVYLFQNGQREKAIQEFQRSYQLHRDDRQALSHLITAYAVQGRFEDAMTLLNQEISKNSSNTEARLLRARIYLQFGDIGNAEADVTPCLSAQFQSAEAHYMQSVIWAMRGQSRLRKSELNEVLNLDPRHAKARVQLAQILLGENSRTGAAEVLDGTPVEQRQIPAILLQQNWIRVAEGRYDDAENAADLLLSKEHLAEALLQKSVVAFQKKNFAAAGELANQVLSSDPSEVRAMEIILKIHVAQKRLSEGVSKLKLAALNAPGSATAQFFLGSILRSTGDSRGAREAFEASRRADPGFLRAQTELALLDVELNQPDLARRRLAGPAAKKDPTALLMLADLDYREGSLSTALAGYQKVVEMEPDNVTALNNLAFLLMEHSHNSSSALQFAQHAKELAPDDAAVDDTLGWIYYQTGRFAAAADRFQSSVNRQPTARRLYHLAMSHYKLGNRTKGQDAFQQASKLDPTLAEAGLASAASR